MVSCVAEGFVESVKLGGKEIMGVQSFDAGMKWVRNNHYEYFRKARKALKNRKKAKARNAFELALSEAILILWLPSLLWLMEDNLAVFVLQETEIILGAERRFPFKGVTTDTYRKARQRLQAQGLKRWVAYFDKAPGIGISGPAVLEMRTPEESGGFNFNGQCK